MRMKKYAYETFYDFSKTKEYNKLFLIHLGKTGDCIIYNDTDTLYLNCYFVHDPCQSAAVTPSVNLPFCFCLASPDFIAILPAS